MAPHPSLYGLTDSNLALPVYNVTDEVATKALF